MKPGYRKVVLLLANIYLLLSICYYWFETFLLNPVAIGLIFAFLCHLYLAKAFGRFIFPLGYILVNLYMFLALYVEFKEFTELNQDAIQLLVVGILYLGLNICCSFLIITNEIHENSQKVIAGQV